MLTVTNPDTFDWAGVSLDDLAVGNAKDTDFTLRIWKILRPKLEEQGLQHIYQKLIKDLIPIIAEIENEGIPVDLDHVDKLKIILSAKLEEIKSKFKQLFPKSDFNLRSNDDLATILFDDKEGLDLLPVSFTKTDKPKTTADDMKTLLSFAQDRLLEIEDEEENV